MTKRQRRSKSNARTWIILACAMLALLVVVPATWAGVFRSTNAATALLLAPYDSEASAARAMAMVSAQPNRAPGKDARALAEYAVERTPLTAAGIRTLGLIAELDGDRSRAAALFEASNRVSRRDFPTRLWLIESAVARGDIGTALKHYDIALRTSTSAKSLLFPVLLNASTDPAIAAPLGQLLKQRPPWSDEFVEELFQRGPDPAAAFAMTRGRFDADDEADRRSVNQLLNRLLDARRFDLAWALYGSVKPQAQPASGALSIKDGSFSQSSEFPPLDWYLVDGVDLNGSRRPRPDASGDMALWLTSANGRAGEVARQLLHLPGGVHRVQFRAGGLPTRLLDRPVLAVKCAANGEILAEFRPETSAPGVTLTFTVPVPAKCPWQWLSIRANGQSDEGTWIDDIRIARSANR